MSLTLGEMKEKLLKLYDPDDLLEALEITSEQLLDRFEDKLINRFDFFEEEFKEEETYEY
jgi:hypothetical protein